MPTAIDDLKAALLEYFDAIPRQKEPNPPDLLAIYTRLDELQAKLDASAPVDLRHYMHAKSYRKAWNFLEGRDAENKGGRCD
jgi:hypothetical protein